jgi:hypothetical protein
MKRLVLINDLMLFSHQPELEALDIIVHRASRSFPARTTLISGDELVAFWSRATKGAEADAVVLIGTRPPLLAAISASPRAQADTILCRTVRTHAQDGHTDAVRIHDSGQPPPLRTGARVLIADDVAMSGATLDAVMTVYLGYADAKIQVRTLFATPTALRRLRARYPCADVTTEYPLEFAPITEGTAIFLSALLFGTLRQRPFLDHDDLLHPYFGTNLAPLRELRRAAGELLPPGFALPRR